MNSLVFLRVLKYKFAGNTLGQILVAVCLCVFTYGAFQFLKYYLLKRSKDLAQKTYPDQGFNLFQLLQPALERTYWFFFLVISLYIGSFALELSNRSEQILEKAVILAVLIEAMLYANVVVKFFVRRYAETKFRENPSGITAMNFGAVMIRVFIFSTLILVALDQWGVNITTLVAGLGVGGIAVALAVQNILGDLFASLTIILDRPFKVGDFLEVGPFLGTVERIGLKTTRLRSLSGEQLIFPNSDLLQSRIRNHQKLEERRVVFTLGISYETPMEKLKKIPQMVKDIISQQKDIRLDRVHFTKFGLISLDFEAVYFVTRKEISVYLQIQEEINFAIFSRFDEENIRFATPLSPQLYPMGPVADLKELEIRPKGPSQKSLIPK